jgi:RIB43A
MTIQNKRTNYEMAREKRDRDTQQAVEAEERAAREVDYTLNHDFMTENPATEQSMLAPHRVKPYHFKGLNAEQQAAILYERA